MNSVSLDCGKFAYKAALEKALSQAVEADTPLVLELVFVSEEEIKNLNARERNIDKVTDVLSFPASEFRPGEKILAAEHRDCVEPVMGKRKGETVQKGERLYLGSVAVCEQRAREQAEEYGHSYEREICYLAVHGFLHCLGYDHETEEKKSVMRAREEEIMQTLGLGRDA